MSEFAVRFESVSKGFPGVQALSDVSIDVTAGSCHALCGENGAGKSTLGKILAGIYVPDGGRLVVNGREARFSGPRAALAAGVGMVHQELAFCANLSVAENLCLGAMPTRRGFLSQSRMRARAREMLAEIGGEGAIDVDRVLGELSVAQQQLVQIAVAVGGGARVIIFDEPTSSLSQREADRLYELIARLRRRDATCIYVSHRLPEVFHLCDTVSVLRDGRHVATRPAKDITQDELVHLMIGRPLAQYLPAPPSAGTPEEVLKVEKLSSPGKLHDISFTLHSGEVLGIAGLVGAGRSELAAALFGLDGAARGAVRIGGKDTPPATPAAAIRRGVGLVPEDRKKQGLVGSASSLHNASLAILDRLSRWTWLRRKTERGVVRGFFEQLRVKSTLDTTVASLSGGNQQKIVLARWLAARSRVLILDEPTRGVDVGAKAEIHSLIGQLAAQGSAVLLISSELPEVLGLATRILVLRAGRLVAEVPREGATQDGLLRLMAGL